MSSISLDDAPPFPIWVLPVDVVLGLDVLKPHEEIKSSLVQWTPGMGDILFCSHTWLKYKFPDSDSNEKLALLKALLTSLKNQSLSIKPQWANSFIMKGAFSLSRKEMANIKFVWLDIASIPQADRDTQLLAIQSIPWYIGRAAYFVVLAGSGWTHESGKSRGINDWARRGWCRLEQLANFLSPAQKPVIICQSTTNMETYPPRGYLGCSCLRYPVGEAEFTVDDDRRSLGPVIQAMIASKQAAALGGHDLVTFRVLHVMMDRLLLGTGVEVEREATLSEWLAALKLDGPSDADECMGALHYAVLAGRVDLAAALLDQGADLSRLITKKYSKQGAQYMIEYADVGVSAFTLALTNRHQPEMIQMLMARGAGASFIDGGGMKSSMGNYFALACIGAINLADKTGTSKYKYNLDVLAEADPSVLLSRCALFGGSNSSLGMTFCGPGVEALEHVLSTYPEASAHWIQNLDGFGASWLSHHMNYCCEPAFVARMLEAGLDVTHAEKPSAKGVRQVMLVMRTLCRLLRNPDNTMFHFGQMYGCVRPTYLHMATAYAHIDALKLLLERTPLDVNGTNALKMTPLHIAARQGHLAIVEVLLAAGADPRAKAERGRTPSGIARSKGHHSIAQRLQVAEQDWRAGEGGKYRVAQVVPAAPANPGGGAKARYSTRYGP